MKQNNKSFKQHTHVRKCSVLPKNYAVKTIISTRLIIIFFHTHVNDNDLLAPLCPNTVALFHALMKAL